VRRITSSTASFAAAASAAETLPITSMFASVTGALWSRRRSPASDTALE
jgi:hypothetical protein